MNRKEQDQVIRTRARSGGARWRRIAAGVSVAIGLSATLTLIVSSPANAAPNFQVPFLCGHTWKAATHNGHSPSYYAVDWNNDNGDGWERGQPVLASAPGTVVTSAYDGSGYGNYVVVDHGGGWRTLYAHLNSRSVSSGSVGQAQQVGTVGGTPSWPVHLHYEQRLNGVVQRATINGVPLAYTTTYNGNPYTSQNGCTSSSPGSTPPAPAVKVCFNGGLGAPCSDFTADDPDLSNDAVGDNTASSIRVPSGGRAAIFRDRAYGGACNEYGEGTHGISGEVGNDQASSIWVGRGCPQAPPPPAPAVKVCFNSGLGAPCSDFTADDPDLSNDAVGDNTASSIRVPSGGRAVIFRDRAYGGARSSARALTRSPATSATTRPVRSGSAAAARRLRLRRRPLPAPGRVCGASTSPTST